MLGYKFWLSIGGLYIAWAMIVDPILQSTGMTGPSSTLSGGGGATGKPKWIRKSGDEVMAITLPARLQASCSDTGSGQSTGGGIGFGVLAPQAPADDSVVQGLNGLTIVGNAYSVPGSKWATTIGLFDHLTTSRGIKTPAYQVVQGCVFAKAEGQMIIGYKLTHPEVNDPLKVITHIYVDGHPISRELLTWTERDGVTSYANYSDPFVVAAGTHQIMIAVGATTDAHNGQAATRFLEGISWEPAIQLPGEGLRPMNLRDDLFLPQ